LPGPRRLAACPRSSGGPWGPRPYSLHTRNHQPEFKTFRKPDEFYFDVMSAPLTLGNLQSAIGFLNQQEFVRSGAVGLVGFCLGGCYALLLSLIEPFHLR
jgi:dienelactone hydrolase